MDYLIRPLQPEDEPILWEMVYQGLSAAGGQPRPPREIVQRPEFARYVQGWGRAGDSGFVAHDKKDGSLLGAVWFRIPIDQNNNGNGPPELAFAVTPGYRGHGIGTALLTQLVRANPDQSTITLRLAAGKPILRLYERFGFKVVDQTSDTIVMRRE